MKGQRTERDFSSWEVAEFNADWAKWKSLIRELPPIRRDKIEAARRAMREHKYDGERVVDETVRRLADEFGPAVGVESAAGRMRFYRLAAGEPSR